MKSLFIKLYDWITAPLYRRLARDLTLQLQEISKSYLEQHEMLTAKMLDELLRLNVRIERAEVHRLARERALRGLEEEPPKESEYSAEEIFDLMKESANSLDVVELCAKRNVPLNVFYDLDARYRGMNPDHIRKVRLLEETNVELRGLLTQLLKQQGLTTDHVRELSELQKVTNGNGRQ